MTITPSKTRGGRRRLATPLQGPARGPSGALPGRRGDILDAALEVFTQLGYHRATIEEIRATSGASIGSIYHHFGGKEQLAAALYLEGLADYQRSFLRLLHASENVEETVKALVAGHLRWVADHPELAAFLLSTREAEVRLATDRALANMNRRAIDSTRAWIERAVEAGAVRPMSTQLFYSVVIGPAQEFARQWIRTRERKAIEEAERELPEAAWRAVRS